MNSATQSFLGRYRLVKVLGQGAMGVVYEAVDTRLNRTVAIKTVLRSHLADETTANEYATRFEREAQAAARLSHPHVVTVFDFGEHEDISYIVMEFIRGRELNQAFEAGQKFELPEAIRIMCELLQALDYAHRQGIVHRDIKPANVMLDPAGRVKLTDFGVARVANANQDRTMPGTLVGTPSYMSPEQILGLAVGSRADIFAAGVILYQFLTGKRPFAGGGPFGVQRKIVQDEPEPPSHANPSVPPGFDLIISRALAKQPENRYENAAAFAADLERIGASLPREVPLIDLDLPDPAPAAVAPPRPQQAAPTPAPAPDPDPLGLTLITEVPFGSPAPPPVIDPDEPPLDPEATVIMFRPSAPPGAANRTAPLPSSAPPPSSQQGTVTGRGPDTSPVRPAPPMAPVRAPVAAAPPAPAAQPAPQPALATRTPGPQTQRPAPAAPPPAAARAASPTRVAAPSTVAAPPRAAPAPSPAAQSSRFRSLLPLAAGAGVAVLVLAGWLLVARPWAAKPDNTPAPQPAVVPAPVPPAPAPAAVPVPTPSPAPTVLPAPPTPTPTAPEVKPAPEPPKPKPAPREASPRNPAAPATQTQAPKPEPRSGGIEPRCGDLLQRMQLGEPLSPEQNTFFQTRCTR